MKISLQDIQLENKRLDEIQILKDEQLPNSKPMNKQEKELYTHKLRKEINLKKRTIESL